jgi:uncharacterized protein (TIGR02001 family)
MYFELMRLCLYFALFYANVMPLQALAQGSEQAPTVIEAPLEETGPWSQRIDFAFGAALTSNYISDGITQTRNGPAGQFYFEAAGDLFYSGIWTSNVSLGDDNQEVDLYAGIRATAGSVELDLAYFRYLYLEDTGDCCGEWIAKADIPVGEQFTLNTRADYDPQAQAAQATLGVTVEFNDKLEFSAAIQQSFATEIADWNAGITWSVTDTLSLDLRVYDSQIDDGRFVATLAYDFSTAE